MIAMIGLLSDGTMLDLLNGTNAIKNIRFKKQRLRKSSYLLLVTHHAGKIGVCQKMKKKIQSNYGHKHRLFFVSDDRIQKFFNPKRTTNKDVFFVECF